MGNLLETGEILGIITVLCGISLCHSKTRRLAFALFIFTKRHAPYWLAPLLIAGAVIPGPIDELLILVIALYPVLRSSRNRRLLKRYITYTWRTT